MTDIGHVYDSIKNGDDDTTFNAVVSQYLTDNNISQTVTEFRLTKWKMLREMGYPSYGDACDLAYKLRSDDPDVLAEGLVDAEVYDAKCLANKLRFPKP